MTAFIVDLDAIKGQIALIATRSVDRAAACVRSWDIRAIAGVRNARLQCEQVRDIRPSKGSCFTCVSLNAFPREASEVFRVCACAETSTVLR